MPVLSRLMLCCLLSLPTGVFAASAWQTLGQLDTPRAEAPMVSYQDSFYIFNGFTIGIRIVANVGKYTPATNRWEIISQTSTSASRPNAVTHNGIVLVGDSVWLIGGRIGTHPGRVSDQVWIFHIPTRSWTRGPDLPKPFAGGGAALLDGRIHVVGGLDVSALCDVNHHFVLDTAQPDRGWQDITARSPLPEPRNHFGTVSIGNKLYVLGGQFGHEHGGLKCTSLAQGAKIVTDVHVYDADTDRWQRLADLPRRRSHTEPSSFVHNGLIYIVGGTRLVGESVIRYDPAANRWTQLDGLQLPYKIVAPAARIHQGKLYVLGGGLGLVTSTMSDIRVLDLPDTAVYQDSSDSDGQNDGTETGTGTTPEPDGQDTTPSPEPDAVLRINAGGEALTDSQGNVWQADTKSRPSAYFSGRGFTYQRAVTVTKNATVPAYVPSAVFTSERWSADNNNGQNWAFPLAPGAYTVRLYFAEIYPGAFRRGARVFDVYLEDTLQEPQFDVFASVGANTAGMLSFQVDSDSTLNLQLWPRIQNPAIKAIEILPCTDGCTGDTVQNRAPSVSAGADKVIVLGESLTLQGAVSDDGLPSGQLSYLWSRISGPGTVTFSETGDLAPGLSFSAAGSYTLQLRAGDGELFGEDTVNVTVSAGAVASTDGLVTRDGAVAFEAEDFSASGSTATHQWVRSASAAAGGQAFMVTTPDKGTLKTGGSGSPTLSYRIFFNQPGLYYVWLRGYGDADSSGEGKSDSLHAGLNGAVAASADKIEGFPPGWHWSNQTRDGVRASVTVPAAGEQAFTLFMREDGLKVDTIVLTKDPAWQP
ncbi:malectin domain-containing carbohydrate-binding protein [Granulosicoccaceae sp. 1_MG-2023]|nr:malectin domain-containing carbohydrate-binding protein [Granulosicoccaceae sp. 1_MG-2023]